MVMDGLLDISGNDWRECGPPNVITTRSSVLKIRKGNSRSIQ